MNHLMQQEPYKQPLAPFPAPSKPNHVPNLGKAVVALPEPAMVAAALRAQERRK